MAGNYDPDVRGEAGPQVTAAIQRAFERISVLRDAVEAIKASRPVTAAQAAAQFSPKAIRDALQAGGSAPLNIQGLIGQASQPQPSFVPNDATLPDAVSSPQSQDGSLVLRNGQLYRFDGSTQPGSWVAIGGAVLEDTHAHRLDATGFSQYQAANVAIGTLFWETDRKVTYIAASVAGVNAWVYQSGQMIDVQANIPNDLGANDKGFQISVTDFAHGLQWGGAGWNWAPGDPGSGMMVLFEVDPSPTTGWHLYDGTAGVTYLKSDGTTGTVTLPDLTSATNKGSYPKAGSPNAGPNAAVAPGATAGGAINSALTGISNPPATGNSATGISTGNDNNFVEVNLIAGVGNVASHTHQHPITDPTHNHTIGAPTDPGHTHTISALVVTVDATGEPRNLIRRPWFRR